MSCALCAGQGVIRIGYHEPPGGHADLAICLCRPGRNLRAQMERGSKALLAARYGVPVESVGLVEDLLDAEDIPIVLRARPVATRGIDEAGARSGKARL